MSHLPSYLAFDLGASTGRVLLGTLDEDRLQVEELHRFPTPVVREEGRYFWDHEALWDELLFGLKTAQRAVQRLRSLSVDSWGVDYVPLDAAGQPLRKPYCYRDPRTEGLIQQVEAVVPAPELYARTGIQFMEINTLYQVIADRDEEPACYRKVANRLFIADYFNYRFSGRAVSEMSMASTSQLLHAQTHRWDGRTLVQLGLGATGWPEVVPSGTLLGVCRMAPEVTVIAGCSHDTACAVAAVPAYEEEEAWAYLSSGTWSLLGVERAAPLLNEAARLSGFTNEVGHGETVRFLKNLTGLWVVQECLRVWQQEAPALTYAALVEEAGGAPPPGQVIDLEDARFARPGDMPEKVRRYCREHGLFPPQTRGALTRLVLESLAEAYRRTLGVLEDVTGAAIQVLHIVGGGSHNDLLCQRTADACRRQVVAGPAEATALGNLLIQAHTLGDLPPGLAIRDIVRKSVKMKTYEPIAAHPRT